jgi:molybdenum cofactor cytidylyltransferase
MRGEVAALLLAAGASLRMGGPKLTALRDHRTLAEHALANLVAAGLDSVVIVASPQPSAYQLFPHGVGEAQVVLNPTPARGLSSSLKLGLAALNPRVHAVVIALADMPRVHAESIRAVIDAWTPGDRVVAPFCGARRGQPVLADIRWALAVAAGLEGDQGLGRAIDALAEGLIRVPVDDDGVLFDVDTPEDLALWREA